MNVLDRGQEALRRQDRIAAEVGLAMTAFALLEAHLLLLFARSKGISENMAARELKPTKTFSRMLQVVDGAVGRRIGTSPAHAYWTSLHAYVRELALDRNYLAHAPISQHGNGPDGLGFFKVGPSITSFLAGDHEQAVMSIEEVIEVRQDFHDALNLVSKLTFAIGTPGLSSLSGPILPRRLRRPVRNRQASVVEKRL